MKGTYLSDLEVLVKTERTVATQVDSLFRRLNRVEEIDEEQRSEMYAILHALKHDAQSGVEAFGALLAAAPPEAGHV